MGHWIPTLLAALLVVTGGAADPPTIIVPTQPDHPVSIAGLPATADQLLAEIGDGDWSHYFAVFVAGEGDVPPVLGSYQVADRSISFTPRFPFVPGQEYRVVFDAAGVTLESDFVIPVPARRASATVSRIYPTADTLPENLLKFYIYFTVPMRGGDVYDHVLLMDGNAKVIDGAFVETVPELWDPGMQRVTVFCHPGRIKRGLALHDRDGPPLRAGSSFRLVVGKMIAADGQPLTVGFEKAFVAERADRSSPEVSSWSLDIPASGTATPLLLSLDEPMDHALLERFVAVVNSDDRNIEGRIEVVDGERAWHFHPDNDWLPGRYAVIVHPALEDLAGNRLDRLFDEEMVGDALKPTGDTVRLEFVIR